MLQMNFVSPLPGRGSASRQHWGYLPTLFDGMGTNCCSMASMISWRWSFSFWAETDPFLFVILSTLFPPVRWGLWFLAPMIFEYESNRPRSFGDFRIRDPPMLYNGYGWNGCLKLMRHVVDKIFWTWVIEAFGEKQQIRRKWRKTD